MMLSIFLFFATVGDAVSMAAQSFLPAVVSPRPAGSYQSLGLGLPMLRVQHAVGRRYVRIGMRFRVQDAVGDVNK